MYEPIKNTGNGKRISAKKGKYNFNKIVENIL